jgi:cytochrome b
LTNRQEAISDPPYIAAINSNLPEHRMKASDRREVPIWDIPTRMFHWSLVALVGINLFLIAPRGGASTVVHYIAGYLVAGLLMFRLIWGFIGSPRSRFADFLLPWSAVRNHILRLLRFDPPHSVGHNPLGGWMIGCLLITLVGMIVTGLFAASRRAVGPFAHLLPPTLASVVGALHSLGSSFLIALIVVHIAGVAAEWFLTGDNLVVAMVTGRKRLSAETALRERPLAPLWRAVLVGLISLALAVGLVLTIKF